MKFSRVVLLGAATLAVAQPHNHVHRHRARHGSPLERRAATTTTVPGPVVTVFELNGQVISAEDVEKGLAEGKYVLVGDTITTAAAASSSSTSTSSSSSSSSVVSSSSKATAEFLASTSSTSNPPPPSTTATPTSTYVPPTTSAAPAQTTTAAASPADSASSNDSTDTDAVNKEFPSGKIPCSTFPSAYGAVPANWLGLGGWTGVQNTPNYNLVDTVISYIETAVTGSSCTANSFCSYACPAGYQKSQWPAAQGNTGQSIGGVYCNSNGMLELSRSGYNQLCTAGVGNVQAVNKLSKVVAVCRTDYPGTESETIATSVEPGSTVQITNPDSATYYNWKGAATTAQYYINPSGYTIEQACQWASAGSNIGNWAPVNMGVGKSTSGETFMSLFPNTPTNPDGVLDFSVKITGGVSGDCSYSNGKYYNNGVESDSGCTVSVSGIASLEFS